MHIQENVSLTAYSTMRLGGTARYLVQVSNRDELHEAWRWASERSLPFIVIGGGSNIVWSDEGFAGLIIVNSIVGFDYRVEPTGTYIVQIGAGENWDSVVARCVELGLSGISALSLIPGSAGATPVQNVGAYGEEIADTLISVEALDTQTQQFVTIPREDCQFGYRTSRFKGADRGRFLITNLTLALTTNPPKPPFYGQLQRYLDEHNQTEPSTADIREAVINIRSHKLPDPAKVANNGSFFANPIVSKEAFQPLLAHYPEIPHWDTTDGEIKLAAAWLIEQCGFKGVHDESTGMATWPNQPLVLVNEHADSTEQLLTFKQKIVDAVQDKFGVVLQQEPELLP